MATCRKKMVRIKESNTKSEKRMRKLVVLCVVEEHIAAAFLLLASSVWVAFFFVFSPFPLQSSVVFYFRRRRCRPSLMSGILAVRYAHRGEGGGSRRGGKNGKSMPTEKRCSFLFTFSRLTLLRQFLPSPPPLHPSSPRSFILCLFFWRSRDRCGGSLFFSFFSFQLDAVSCFNFLSATAVLDLSLLPSLPPPFHLSL